MKNALIPVLAGFCLFGSAAAAASAERSPSVSNVPQDGYYRTENGYMPAVPYAFESRETRRTERRLAFVPDANVTSPTPRPEGIRRYRDESLSAPIFAD